MRKIIINSRCSRSIKRNEHRNEFSHLQFEVCAVKLCPHTIRHAWMAPFSHFQSAWTLVPLQTPRDNEKQRTYNCGEEWEWAAGICVCVHVSATCRISSLWYKHTCRLMSCWPTYQDSSLKQSISQTHHVHSPVLYTRTDSARWHGHPQSLYPYSSTL